MPSFLCGRALREAVQRGVGHAGERTRQGAVPLGSGHWQVNTSAAVQHPPHTSFQRKLESRCLQVGRQTVEVRFQLALE
jgi:hypothetical protein